MYFSKLCFCFSLHSYSEVELLDRMWFCLHFWRTHVYVFMMCSLLCLNSLFGSFHALPTFKFLICVLFDERHSNSCEVVSQCVLLLLFLERFRDWLFYFLNRKQMELQLSTLWASCLSLCPHWVLICIFMISNV